MTSHRLFDMVEEYAREQIRRATACIALNTGFTRTNTRAFSVLTDVMRKYLQQMWLRAKMLTEHGRLQPNFLDVNTVFKDIHISAEELGEYMRQVGPFGPERKVPKFPVKPATRVDSCGIALVEKHGGSPGSDSRCSPAIPSESQNGKASENKKKKARGEQNERKKRLKANTVDKNRKKKSPENDAKRKTQDKQTKVAPESAEVEFIENEEYCVEYQFKSGQRPRGEAHSSKETKSLHTPRTLKRQNEDQDGTYVFAAVTRS